jgi:hypothetical protein
VATRLRTLVYRIIVYEYQTSILYSTYCLVWFRSCIYGVRQTLLPSTLILALTSPSPTPTPTQNKRTTHPLTPSHHIIPRFVLFHRRVASPHSPPPSANPFSPSPRMSINPPNYFTLHDNTNDTITTKPTQRHNFNSFAILSPFSLPK